MAFRTSNTLEVLVYDAVGNEVELRLPARFALCPSCDGCGTDRGRSVECDGGGFTASEWAEQDEDFREDYLAGVYDRPCETCAGTPGRVLEVDRNACSKAQLALYDEHIREEREYQALVAMERRYGA